MHVSLNLNLHSHEQASKAHFCCVLVRLADYQVDITKWQYNILMLWVMNFSFQVLTYINLSLRLRFATAN